MPNLTNCHKMTLTLCMKIGMDKWIKTDHHFYLITLQLLYKLRPKQQSCPRPSYK